MNWRACSWGFPWILYVVTWFMIYLQNWRVSSPTSTYFQLLAGSHFAISNCWAERVLKTNKKYNIRQCSWPAIKLRFNAKNVSSSFTLFFLFFLEHSRFLFSARQFGKRLRLRIKCTKPKWQQRVKKERKTIFTHTTLLKTGTKEMADSITNVLIPTQTRATRLFLGVSCDACAAAESVIFFFCCAAHEMRT